MAENGFDQYKHLYEERFRLNEKQHEEIIKALTSLRSDVQGLRAVLKTHSAWWGAVGAGVIIVLTYIAPLLIGGCNVG